ncbi:uncharacterized protein LOC101846007 [Aplysia californica]|uniref:Uncharacterized protein LOC101846007 n=1 Tax=Aplysia californica TaxID=6500 RepID=A0ABM0JUK2_APLCA|nr:uncharacterized protein LOC101846007 [Aplysia californica]
MAMVASSGTTASGPTVNPIIDVVFTVLIFGPVFVAGRSSPPTVDDLTNKICPSKTPRLCVPFGVCCRLDQYCDRKRTRDCKSCFPFSYEERQNETKLREWCRFEGQGNVSRMENLECLGACLHRFGIQKDPIEEDCSEDRPLFCSSTCCAKDEYCDWPKRSCEPCIPESLSTDSVKEWCAKESIRNHISCAAACKTNGACDSGDKQEETDIGQGWMIACTVLIIVFLMLLIYLVFKSCRGRNDSGQDAENITNVFGKTRFYRRAKTAAN